MNPRDAVAEMMKTNRRIVFNGDGYSAEWPIEAKKRGIPNLSNAVEGAWSFSFLSFPGTTVSHPPPP
jgi:glutamine synthetase type III